LKKSHFESIDIAAVLDLNSRVSPPRYWPAAQIFRKSE